MNRQQSEAKLNSLRQKYKVADRGVDQQIIIRRARCFNRDKNKEDKAMETAQRLFR